MTVRSRAFCHAAGCRYWTASLLPAFVGTTLPFWLRPAGFQFKWPAAIVFLAATTFVHAGFSFVHARFEPRFSVAKARPLLLVLGGTCILAGTLLGVDLNSRLTFHRGVPESIFVVYWCCVLFAGVLYVVPPFRFHRRAGGETVVCVTLGLTPVLGAYLVQVGDLTTSVYLASSPLVAATALWIWTGELRTRERDELEGRRTLAVLFGPRFSRRFAMPALALLLYGTLFMAVFTSSIAPWALAALVTIPLVRTVVATTWHEHAGSAQLHAASRKAFAIHLATGLVIAASPLPAL